MIQSSELNQGGLKAPEVSESTEEDGRAVLQGSEEREGLRVWGAGGSFYPSLTVSLPSHQLRWFDSDSYSPYTYEPPLSKNKEITTLASSCVILRLLRLSPKLTAGPASPHYLRARKRCAGSTCERPFSIRMFFISALKQGI